MRYILAVLAMLNVAAGYRNFISKNVVTASLSRSSSSLLHTGQGTWNKKRISSIMSMSTATSGGYLSVHVKGMITPGAASSDTFYRNCLQNAKNSILEAGISRFDVLTRVDSKEEFLLVEVYNSQTGPADHKLTGHYNSWRENVADLMAQPRSAVKYITLFPPASNWKTDPSASSVEEEHFVKNIPWTQEPFAADTGSSTSNPSMLAVAVDVEVVEGGEEAFIAASLANCQSSVKEPGVTRFDFMQNNDNPRNFLLFEVYNNPNGPVEHKATAHYAAWAAAVKDLMARPRTAVKYATRFPTPLYWHRNSFLTHQESEGEVDAEEGAARGLSAVTGLSFGFMGPKINMGRGIAVAAIASALKDLGVKKPFIVTGKGGFDRLKGTLFVPSGALSSSAGSDYEGLFCISGEPTVEDAREATAKAVAAGCDGVLCVGGGSALDLGKAVAALMTNKGDVYDYLEIVGKGQAITNKPMPLIAVPTTSGTGSECTKNAVLKSAAHGRKASMRHDSMLPLIAIIDPCLSVSCPQQVTAHVGLDTLCQVIEPYVSNAANPIVDALAKEGILRAARSLRAVVANGGDLSAREDLAIASVLGGLCLANAKLGAVHGYAAVLGGMYETAPHGAICAVLLPHVFRKNAEKLEGMASAGDATARIRLRRFTEVARILTGLENATVWQGVTWLEILVKDLSVPSLSKICPVTAEQIPLIAESTSGSSSTKGNPVLLTVHELEEILRKAF